MEIVELSEGTWPALEGLFGDNGAVAGCWCMWFRLPSKEFRNSAYEPNRKAMRELVKAGEPVGLLGMEGDQALGWVAVAPRAVYRRLAGSPVAKPVDPGEDLSDVWSVTCFFIHRTARRAGISSALLAEAVRYAAERGARIVEGYPVDTRGAKISSGELYHGTLSTFRSAGFRLVEARGTRRALVRKEVA